MESMTYFKPQEDGKKSETIKHTTKTENVQNKANEFVNLYVFEKINCRSKEYCIYKVGKRCDNTNRCKDQIL